LERMDSNADSAWTLPNTAVGGQQDLENGCYGRGGDEKSSLGRRRGNADEPTKIFRVVFIIRGAFLRAVDEAILL
jgi:hypothetical protein